MADEVELKFRVADAAALRRRLRALGFRVAVRRLREENWLFDDDRGTLRRSGRVLRLRRSGTSWFLTAKGPRRPGELKRRAEQETEVASGAACRGVLELLGYRAVLRYGRWRTRWRRPSEAGEVAWDETPVGIYLEVEGGPAWVRRTARELGLRLEAAEPRSYPEIYCSSAEGP